MLHEKTSMALVWLLRYQPKRRSASDPTLSAGWAPLRRVCVCTAFVVAFVPVTAPADALPGIAPIVFRAYDSTTFESRIYVKDPTDPTPELVHEVRGGSHYVKWSPDGQQILFDAHPDEEEGGILYVMDRRGLGVRRITPALPARTIITGHTWAPGRDQVTYVTGQVHNNGAVWVVDLDDTDNPRKLIDTGGVFHRPPAWSPDGSRLAYAWAEAEGSAIDLWVVDRGGITPGASQIEVAECIRRGLPTGLA